MKKIIVSIGLAVALVSTAFGGFFNHSVNTPGGFWQGPVTVPNAGVCYIYVSANNGSGNFAINNGPLGNYTMMPGQSLTLNNQAISAGTYTITQYLGSSGGASVTNITW